MHSGMLHALVHDALRTRLRAKTKQCSMRMVRTVALIISTSMAQHVENTSTKQDMIYGYTDINYVSINGYQQKKDNELGVSIHVRCPLWYRERMPRSAGLSLKENQCRTTSSNHKQKRLWNGEQSVLRSQ